jgi:hypothetical protein
LLFFAFFFFLCFFFWPTNRISHEYQGTRLEGKKNWRTQKPRAVPRANYLKLVSIVDGYAKKYSSLDSTKDTRCKRADCWRTAVDEIPQRNARRKQKTSRSRMFFGEFFFV